MSEALLDVEPSKVTERHMLDLIHRRFSQVNPGNGPRYAIAEHVKNTAGWGNRTLDCIVMDLWPSGGLQLHGLEVKCSRSDWLRELADPSKSESFTRYLDRMWLVVSSRLIVKDDLPDGWGLLVRQGDRLVQAVAAPIRQPEPLPRDLLAPLLRSTARTADRRAHVPPEVSE